MHSLSLAVKGELYKLKQNRKIWLCFVFIIVLAILSGIMTIYSNEEKNNQSWRETLQQSISSDKSLIGQLGNDETNKKYSDQLANKLKINEYALKHDIPPLDSSSAIGFIKKNVGLTWFITIMLTVIASGIMANEYRWGTIKFLLIKPYSRNKIVISKFLTILIVGMLFFLLFIIMVIVVGLFLYGIKTSHFVHLSLRNGEVVENNIWFSVIKLYVYAYIPCISYAALALMISTFLKSSGAAIALSIGVLAFGGVLEASLREYPLSKYLLLANTNLIDYVQGEPPIAGMNEWFSITVLLVYSAVFVGVTAFVFGKKDVI